MIYLDAELKWLLAKPSVFATVVKADALQVLFLSPTYPSRHADNTRSSRLLSLVALFSSTFHVLYHHLQLPPILFQSLRRRIGHEAQ